MPSLLISFPAFINVTVNNMEMKRKTNFDITLEEQFNMESYRKSVSKRPVEHGRQPCNELAAGDADT